MFLEIQFSALGGRFVSLFFSKVENDHVVRSRAGGTTNKLQQKVLWLILVINMCESINEQPPTKICARNPPGGAPRGPWHLQNHP